MLPTSLDLHHKAHLLVSHFIVDFLAKSSILCAFLQFFSPVHLNRFYGTHLIAQTGAKIFHSDEMLFLRRAC